MRTVFDSKQVIRATVFLLPLFLFWMILCLEIPHSFSKYFSSYSLGLFLVAFFLYYLSFRLSEDYSVLAGFGLTMALFALTLSFKWTSGYSDNTLIGGLLPYKDTKNYYYGANLILNGFPMVDAGQSTQRPLFPGFLSALLILTNQNLKIALAIMAQLAGIGLYLSTCKIRKAMGIAAAGLYATLMYFFIQPLIGYALSEALGFPLGCFAFILIWQASRTLKWPDLILGLFTLMVAVSARAGAFIVFPLLVGWVGWAFRGEKRYSLKAAFLAFTTVVVGYIIVNIIYARLLGIPPGNTFGNFSYAIYGQVRGGAGWHSAVEELGKQDPSIVYREALQFFLKHPTSLFIGFAKAYRDFFLGDSSIFAFRFLDWRDWPNFLAWAGMVVSLIRGGIHLLKDFRSNSSLMLLSGFTGVILSIPFLPPIDSGSRFYASTMPFFFAVSALGVAVFVSSFSGAVALEKKLDKDETVIRVGSILLMMLVLVIPVLTYITSRPPSYTIPVCPSRQRPFAIEIHQGSYIDLIKDGSQQCGSLPEVCLNDFDQNNVEKYSDDYYQLLLRYSYENTFNVRIVPAIDLVKGQFHYFFISSEKLQSDTLPNLILGCSTRIKTKNQSIYQVESVMSEGK